MAPFMERAYFCQKPLIFHSRQLRGGTGLVQGAQGTGAPTDRRGANSWFDAIILSNVTCTRTIERTVSGIDCIALVVQFGGGRVTEGEPDRWRSMNLPTQSLLPAEEGTHALALLRHRGLRRVLFPRGRQRRPCNGLEVLAQPKDAPIPFSDPLVGAAALQLVGELQKGTGADGRLHGASGRRDARTDVSRPGDAGDPAASIRVTSIFRGCSRCSTTSTPTLPPTCRLARLAAARGSQPGPFQPHLPGRHGRAAAPVRAGGAARPRPQAPDAVDAAHLPDRRRVRVQFAEPPDGLLSHRAFDDAGPVPGALQATKRAYEVTQGDSLDGGQARLLHYTPPLAGGPPPVEATVRLPLSAEALKIYLWSNGVEPLKLLVTAG